jgi:hypothetical protein
VLLSEDGRSHMNFAHKVQLINKPQHSFNKELSDKGDFRYAHTDIIFRFIYSMEEDRVQKLKILDLSIIPNEDDC